MLPYVGVVYALTTGVLLQTTIVVLTRLLDTPHLCLSIDFIDIHDDVMQALAQQHLGCFLEQSTPQQVHGCRRGRWR